MALTPQSMDVPMFVGQDSSMDPRVLQPGALAVVENGRLSYRGQVRKRYGFTAQPKGNITTGVQVFSGGSVLFQHDGANINAYSSSLQQWTTLGRACGGQLTTIGTVQTNNSVSQCSSAATAALQCVAWCEGAPGPLYYAVMDLQTGVQIVPRTTITVSGQAPNVLQLGGNFYIFWGDLTAGSAKLMMLPVLGTRPAQVQAASELAPTVSTNTQYDVCVTNDGTQFLLASEDRSRGSTPSSVVVGAYLVTTAGACSFIASISTSIAAGVLTQPSCFQTPDDGLSPYGGVAVNTLYRVYGSGGNISGTLGAGAFHRVTCTQAGQMFIEYGPYGCISAGTFAYNSGGFYTFTTNSSPTVAQNGLHLMSRAFSSAYTGYAWCVVDAGDQSLNVLLDAAGVVVAVSGANGSAAPYDGTGISLSHCTNDGASNFTFAALSIRTVQETGASPIITSVGVTSKNLALGAPHLYPAQLDNVTYIGGAQPLIYDGAALTEWGFYFYPAATAVAGAAGTGALTGGNYQVTACYSWYDATGKVWRSPTSFIQSVTGVPANGSITVTLPYLWLTQKTNVTVEVYCTANIGGQTGTEFFLATSAPNQGPQFSGTQPTTNGTFNVSIAAADTTIATGLGLYTNGGVPDYLTPPSMVHMSSSGLRLYACSGEDNQVYVTTPATPGVPLNFLLSQSVAVESSRGGLVASQVQDGQLWIATQRAWFSTNADANSLAAGTIIFSPPARAAFADGCVSAASVLATASGVYYQSSRGIELITRTSQPTFVGEPVKNVTGAVLDAYVVPSQEQLRFVFASQVLCYDYERHTWLQHVFQSAPTLASGCAWNGLGVLGTADGTVRLENTASFFDDTATPIVMRLQTPWLRLGGLAGYGKAWEFLILGEQETPCNLQVQLAYNDDPTWIDTLTVPATSAIGVAYGSGTTGVFGHQSGPIPPAPFGNNPAGNAYKWLGIIPRADGNSFKFEFQTLNSGGEDVRLNFMTLIYGLQPGGVVQSPSSRKFG